MDKKNNDLSRREFLKRDKKNNDLSRREFLKRLGIGTFSAAALMGLEPITTIARELGDNPQIPTDGDNLMTYRVNRHSGDKVSLLGYGMMRLPQKDRKIDQALPSAVIPVRNIS